jgi:hypothetical protein
MDLSSCGLVTLRWYISAHNHTEGRRDTNIGISKTSALAVLFNGPGDDVRDFVGDEKKAGKVREKAKGMEVQLVDQ